MTQDTVNFNVRLGSGEIRNGSKFNRGDKVVYSQLGQESPLLSYPCWLGIVVYGRRDVYLSA